MEWVSGKDREAVILWFYGPSGTGKSTIARKIAELCNLNKLLLASFFFSRSDPSRNNPKSLIATIAYQIAINLPETQRKIVAAIERDPLVLTRSLEAQVTALVIDPLRKLLEGGYFDTSTSRRLIIIDGLDKCDTPAAQSKVLDVITLLLQKYHLPILILIASRPKRHLTHSFNAGFLREHHTTLGLDATYQPNDGRQLFLFDTFTQIRDPTVKGYLDPSVFVQESSEQFMYASTLAPQNLPSHLQNTGNSFRPRPSVRSMPSVNPPSIPAAKVCRF
jgi:hypothetical protein